MDGGSRRELPARWRRAWTLGMLASAPPFDHHGRHLKRERQQCSASSDQFKLPLTGTTYCRSWDVKTAAQVCRVRPSLRRRQRRPHDLRVGRWRQADGGPCSGASRQRLVFCDHVCSPAAAPGHSGKHLTTTRQLGGPPTAAGAGGGDQPSVRTQPTGPHTTREGSLEGSVAGPSARAHTALAGSGGRG